MARLLSTFVQGAQDAQGHCVALVVGRVNFVKKREREREISVSAGRSERSIHALRMPVCPQQLKKVKSRLAMARLRAACSRATWARRGARH